MMMKDFSLVSEIMAQSLGRTVEILNAIQSGSVAGKNDQGLTHVKTSVSIEDKEDSI